MSDNNLNLAYDADDKSWSMEDKKFVDYLGTVRELYAISWIPQLNEWCLLDHRKSLFRASECYHVKEHPENSMEIDEDICEPVSDMVNHPQHYTDGSVECIDAIESALTKTEFRGYCKGNAMKYLWRERLKGGDEDLAKARWYLDRIIDGSAPRIEVRSWDGTTIESDGDSR